MKTMHPKKDGGLTLLEMVAALTIFGIVMAAIFGVLIPMMKAYSRQQIRHELYMQTENALKTLNRTVSGSFGWLEGDSLSIKLIAESGDTITILRTGIDSSLCVNGRVVLPVGYGTAFFRVGYKPISTDAMTLTPKECFELLDANADGMIRGTEISKTASLQLTLTSSKAHENYTGSTYPKIPQAIVDISIVE
jgi:prepilin-type N-terminal cleavage/methylation domain-containing protein